MGDQEVIASCPRCFRREERRNANEKTWDTSILTANHEQHGKVFKKEPFKQTQDGIAGDRE
jgi:hypothetical protein